MDAATNPGAKLWRNKNFNIFWFGQALSNMGDAFALVAIPLLVLEATGSVIQMGLVTATFTVGWLIVGLFAGSLVDRFDRRLLMIVCDVGRAVVYGLIPLGWWLAGPQVWMIYIITLLGAALGICFQVAYSTAIPNLVERDQLVDANGRLSTTWALSLVLGPMLAGILIQLTGSLGAIAFNALTFAISAFSLIFVKLRRSEAHQATAHGKINPIEDLKLGIQFLWNEPVLRAVTLIMACVVFVLRASDELFIYVLKAEMAQGDREIGLLLGISGLGAIVAGFLGPTLRRRWGFGVCFLGGIALEGLALVGVALSSNLAMMTAFALFYKFVQEIRVIAMFTVRQQVTPDHLLGRVSSAFLLVASVPGPIGITFLSWMAAVTGGGAVILFMGVVSMLIALVGTQTAASMSWPENREAPLDLEVTIATE